MAGTVIVHGVRYAITFTYPGLGMWRAPAGTGTIAGAAITAGVQAAGVLAGVGARAAWVTAITGVVTVTGVAIIAGTGKTGASEQFSRIWYQAR
ncbi:MAG: hypothetical protein HY765_08150 [Rhodomicrobium sp.]|nr:hypothetical protein [Rhodomicrobium sp.]